MPLDFRNPNTVWASVLVETLHRLGLTTAVICPGSRSTPLAVAFAQHEQIEAIPILDERSAAFFALGIARQSRVPVALVCTSGTAGANFYPAAIEARESRVPLLILTADRPPELRHCHSGQTIDQQKLYGSYPNWQAELALPSVGIGMLRYLRQTLVLAWERSRFPVPGPVHLNLPFRDPLAPTSQIDPDSLPSPFELEEFFTNLTATAPPLPASAYLPFSKWQRCERGIIVAGPAQPRDPQEYCQAIAQLSQALGWVILAEALSPLRNYVNLNPYLISTYDLILRNQKLAQQLAPAMVVQIGELPTSKELRTWLNECQPQRWIIEPSEDNLDPLHGKTTHLRIAIEQWEEALSLNPSTDSNGHSQSSKKPKATRKIQAPKSRYLQKWCEFDIEVRRRVNEEVNAIATLFEGKAAWLLSQVLPPETPLFIANSTPVRDIEFFWSPGNGKVRPYFNRGANGIDGTLSTALGMAYRNQSSVLLTGDLALLHDTNGFLLRPRFVGHLTIILINNNGGGIFEMLPIAKFDPPFEEFFATPQEIDFAPLCLTYKVEYQRIGSWEQLKMLLNPLPTEGIRVLEVRTDRKADAKWRQDHLGKFAAGISD